MPTTDLGACEWFAWDLRRSNLIDRGQLDQIVGEFLSKHPRAEPPGLAEYLVGKSILTNFQADRLRSQAPKSISRSAGADLTPSAHALSTFASAAISAT